MPPTLQRARRSLTRGSRNTLRRMAICRNWNGFLNHRVNNNFVSAKGEEEHEGVRLARYFESRLDCCRRSDRIRAGVRKTNSRCEWRIDLRTGLNVHYRSEVVGSPKSGIQIKE